jgi:hypothetical protein
MRDVIACYDKLVYLFERVHFFLERLNCYNNVKLTTAMTELLGTIMAQVLFILALSTKEMRRRGISTSIYLTHLACLNSGYEIERFLKRLLGRTDVEDALLQLDTLTKEENLQMTARILEVADHIDENMNTITETTQAVRDTMNNLEAETRTASRTAQATYTSVYHFLDLFINVLTVFLAICQNRSRQHQRFVEFRYSTPLIVDTET